MKKIVFTGVIILIVTLIVCSTIEYTRIRTFSTPTNGEKIVSYKNGKSALIVIDIQEDFTGKTAKAPFPYKNSESFIRNVNKIIDIAINKEMPVIYIKQEFEDSLLDLPLSKGRVLKGKVGSQIDSRVKIKSNNIFIKNRSDAFSNTDFEKFLVKNQINHLYVIGLDAKACVFKTSKGALNRNYKVTAIQDGIITLNISSMGEILSKYRKNNINIIKSSEFIKDF